MTTSLKTNANSLIIIDSRVTDWQSLIGDITDNSTLLVLDPSRDGLTQIAEAVANSTNIDAIHIISHGNAGSLLLGSSSLNNSNLSNYQAQLTTIGNALSTNGDILLYGCDVAQGDVGQQFIEQLSTLTGADIAASTDLTGAANQGGDWVLEAATGAIESSLALSTASLNNYTNILAVPVISLSPATQSVTEGNAGTKTVTITATLTEAATSVVTVDYATDNLTANAGTDYVANSGVLTFAIGETSKTIDIIINGDITPETDEDFYVFLSNPVGVTLDTNDGDFATVTITNDDGGLLPIISLSPTSRSVLEGNTGTSIVTMTATLSAAAAGAVTVDYATDNLTANAGTDYVASSGVLTFAAGQTTKTFDIVINGDTLNETDDDFFVTLSNPTGATLDTNGGDSATITILNDDLTISLSPTSSSVTEGDAGTKVVTMTATLSAPAVAAVTVNYATSDISATAGADYVTSNGLLTFAAGETTKTFDVVINGDTTPEIDESFSVVLSTPTGAVLAGNSGSIVTITNDDIPTISLSPASPSVTEGNTGTKVVTMTATLSAPAVSAVTVDYATSDSTATAGSDYVTNNGQLTFAVGETTKTFDIVINGDTAYENDESFSVALSTPTGAVLDSNANSATVTITNDDVAPIISLSPASPSVTEGNTGTKVVTMTATLSAAATSEITVNYATSDSTATAGSDYVTNNGVLTFAVGETTKTFDVVINGDTVYESDESFSVVLSTPTGAVLDSNANSATVTITNDDVFNNHAPVLATPATLSYTDTAFVDNFVTKTGTLVGSDVDAGTTLTYGITDGNDNHDGTFSKDNAYGTLTVTTATGAYTFAPLASAIEPLAANVTDSQLTVTVSDGALTTSKVFTVAITQSGTTETIGNDALSGGVGANNWAGLAGNDTYYVDVAGDNITEAASAGSDMVYSTAANYTLAANVETLVIWGAGVNGTGNDDNNYLFGSALNNTLDGKGGVDGMVGGAGNDTYIVDIAGDTVTEKLNQGFDAINASVSYTLAANVEVLTLTGILGTEALNGNGNGDANYLYGNAGNNSLDGKAGADVMVGKAGDDTYYVDNANDIILENVNEGTDSVISSVSYTLAALNSANPTLVAGANAENLTITGTALNAFGNSLNNTLIGNNNNNVLVGDTGTDTMTGGVGDDTYYVDVAGDVVHELVGEGADIVYSTATDYTLSDNIETIVVWGAGLNGTGNAQDNYVFGNTYGGGPVNNILSGGAGNDILMGFDGADTYIGGTDQDTYNLTEKVAATDIVQIAAGDSVATIALMDKAIGFTLGKNAVFNSGVDKLDLVSTTIAANITSQDGTDAGAIQTNSITNGIISFQGVGGATIAANALNLNDALTYLQTNITDGSSVAFVAGADTYVFQDGGVTDTAVDLIGVIATSMNNNGLAAGAVWLV